MAVQPPMVCVRATRMPVASTAIASSIGLTGWRVSWCDRAPVASSISRTYCSDLPAPSANRARTVATPSCRQTADFGRSVKSRIITNMVPSGRSRSRMASMATAIRSWGSRTSPLPTEITAW